MFDALATGVKEVTNLDLASLSDEELSEAVVELARLRSALEAGEAMVDKAWNDRRAWAADGAKAGSAWLARRTGEAKSDCGSRMWLARVVEDMALVKEAWLAGNISAAHVRRLAKARNRRTEEAFAESEAMLVNLATTLSFAQFARALDYWMLRADPDGAEESDLERRERRRAACDETLNGMFSGSFLLDPIGGTIVSNELRRLETKLFEADWAEAKQRLGRGPLIFELARTPDQRRADAMVEMAERSAGNVENKKAKPLFTLLLGSDTFSRLSELEDGQVVSPGRHPPLDQRRGPRAPPLRRRDGKGHRRQPQALLHRRPEAPDPGPGPGLLPRLLRRAGLPLPGRSHPSLVRGGDDRSTQRAPGLRLPQPPPPEATTATASRRGGRVTEP